MSTLRAIVERFVRRRFAHRWVAAAMADGGGRQLYEQEQHEAHRSEVADAQRAAS
jgi:hypothetical protein